MIVGIDFSLTATGVCSIDEAEAECVTIGSKKEEHWFEFPNRVYNIGYGVLDWASGGDIDDLVDAGDVQFVIESPAFLAKSSSLDRMFGGWWMLVDYLGTRLGIEPPLLVTPTQMKKFACGKGNANKDEVLAAVIRRYPDVPVRNNNEADALVLAAIGAAVMGEPFNGTLNQKQQEVVDAVRNGRD